MNFIMLASRWRFIMVDAGSWWLMMVDGSCSGLKKWNDFRASKVIINHSWWWKWLELLPTRRPCCRVSVLLPPALAGFGTIFTAEVVVEIQAWEEGGAPPSRDSELAHPTGARYEEQPRFLGLEATNLISLHMWFYQNMIIICDSYRSYEALSGCSVCMTNCWWVTHSG